MSKRVESMVWDVTFPTQSQKLILLKLADYGNDEGSSIYPARDTLADKVGCSLATVKSALKAFRECGLLTVLKEGGNGPRDTTHYGLHVEMIKALAEGRASITGSSDKLQITYEQDAEIKGPNFGQGANQGANLPPDKGPAGWPQSVKNQYPKTRERVGETKFSPPSRVQADTPPRLLLREDGLSFVRKLDLASKVMPDGFSKGVEVDGAIVINADGSMSRRPPLGSAAFDDLMKARERPPGLTEKSRAIIGDVA
jgi:hypothetical protein